MIQRGWFLILLHILFGFFRISNTFDLACDIFRIFAMFLALLVITHVLLMVMLSLCVFVCVRA